MQNFDFKRVFFLKKIAAAGTGGPFPYPQTPTRPDELVRRRLASALVEGSSACFPSHCYTFLRAWGLFHSPTHFFTTKNLVECSGTKVDQRVSPNSHQTSQIPPSNTHTTQIAHTIRLTHFIHVSSLLCSKMC
jgi:hypothetical protein